MRIFLLIAVMSCSFHTYTRQAQGLALYKFKVSRSLTWLSCTRVGNWTNSLTLTTSTSTSAPRMGDDGGKVLNLPSLFAHSDTGVSKRGRKNTHFSRNTTLAAFVLLHFFWCVLVSLILFLFRCEPVFANFERHRSACGFGYELSERLREQRLRKSFFLFFVANQEVKLNRSYKKEAILVTSSLNR